MTGIWHASYFLTTLFTFSDPFQVLKKVSSNERMGSGVLYEVDSSGVPRDSF